MTRIERRIHLAGPISDCDENQLRGWRSEIVGRWSREERRAGARGGGNPGGGPREE